MILIGISGKKYAGKDTIASMIKELVEQYKDYRFYHINFADALYEEVVCILWPSIHRDNKSVILQKVAYLKAHKERFRPLLQWWGTNWRREEHGEQYWINKWCNKIRDVISCDSIIVCSDVRFINEFLVVKKLSGTLWRVNREPLHEIHDTDWPAKPLQPDAHPSETELDAVADWDKVFYNNATKLDLQAQVEMAFRSLLQKHQLQIQNENIK